MVLCKWIIVEIIAFVVAMGILKPILVQSNPSNIVLSVLGGFVNKWSHTSKNYNHIQF